MDERALVQTLENVMTPDTNVVKQATVALRENFFKDPQSFPVLIQCIRSHHDHRVRQLAAVEARSLIAKFWGKDNARPKITDDVKAQIRESLLVSATQDDSPIVRHSAARVVAGIARIDLPGGAWQNLPSIVTQAASSDKVGDREVGTYLLYTLLETLADVVADKWRDFLQLFARTISDGESITVRLNTLLALGRMSEVINTEECPEAVGMFRELLPHMVNIIKEVAASGDEDKSNQAFEVFQTLLLVDNALISAHLGDLVQFFTELAVNKGLTDDIRSKALHFLMSCLRHKKMKMQALRVGESLTLRAMELVTEFKESEEESDMTPSRTALGLLDFMASALPPSQVIVPLLNALPQYASHSDPAYRKAGTLSLGYCVEGAPEFIATQLSSIFPIIITLLNDPEAAVRHAALHTITQLADDLSEELGKEHARLMPLLIRILETSTEPDMWNRSCNAIDTVLIGIEQHDVEAYLPTLMPKLLEMFQKGDHKLKGSTVSAIGSAAIAAKTSFQPYFETMMNALSPFITIKDGDEELDLRGVVLDCMGSIADAVGKEAFTPYVQPLMTSAEESLQLGHIRLRETSFMFFSTIAKLYGEDFQPFLAVAMEAVFHSLDQDETDEDDQLEISEEMMEKIISVGASGTDPAAVSGDIVDMDGMSDFEDDDEEDWDELNVVNAIALEKEVAAETIGEILAHCKVASLPYLERVVTTLVEKAGHPYEGVRKAAISTLWRAYASLWQVSEERGMQKWEKGLPLKVQPTEELTKFGQVVAGCTLSALKTEEDRHTVKDICINIAETLKLCGPAFLADSNGNNILELTTQVVMILQKVHPSQMDDDDEEELAELDESSEYDWQVIDAAMDVCLGLAEALGPQYVDVWKIVDKHMIKYASSTEPRERSVSVGVISESIKHMGELVTPHTEKLLKLLMHRLSDEDPDTKANTIYGLGMLALMSQDSQKILAQYPSILLKLEPLLGNPEGGRLLDNAAGCVARMIMAHPDNVPLADLLNALVTLLPLKEDFEENEPVYTMLVKLYQSSNQAVFNITQQLVPVFSQVLSPPEDQLNANTRSQVIELVRFLAGKEPSLIQNYPNLVAAAAQ
ncbi:armadillo-type protein [Geopyxis carbonaria]|nr:armadillo-type protein [Geopyxis carbonaria]